MAPTHIYYIYIYIFENVKPLQLERRTTLHKLVENTETYIFFY